MDINQFIAVSYKVGDENATLRQMFVKKHVGNHDVKPADRTLLVMNVPPYLNENCFKHLYEQCGAIERIFFHKKPKKGIDEDEDSSKSLFTKKNPIIGYKCAYIVFKKPSGLKSALKAKALPLIPTDMTYSLGVKKYIQDYKSSFIDVKAVTKEIEEYMQYYDQTFEEEKEKSKDMTVDEDGWITVTKHSKRSKIPRKENISRKILEKQKKVMEKRTLLNFYRCQLKQQKEDKLLDLQKKFEKDKKRIALMRENRKFRPY